METQKLPFPSLLKIKQNPNKEKKKRTNKANKKNPPPTNSKVQDKRHRNVRSFRWPKFDETFIEGRVLCAHNMKIKHGIICGNCIL